jgi:hypothetical protein
LRPSDKLADLRVLMEELRVEIESLEKTRGEISDSMQAIFKVNQELGRIARQEPALKKKMIEIQLSLNAMTVGLKRMDVAGARAVFQLAEDDLSQVGSF